MKNRTIIIALVIAAVLLVWLFRSDLGIMKTHEANEEESMAYKEFREESERMERDAERALLFAEKGTEYFKEGMFKEAAENYELSAEAFPATYTYLIMGACYENLYEYEKAMGAYRSGIMLVNKTGRTRHAASLHIGAGRVLHIMKKYDEAIAEFRTAVDYDKKLGAAALFRIAEIYEEMGEREKAIESYKDSIRKQSFIVRLLGSPLTREAKKRIEKLTNVPTKIFSRGVSTGDSSPAQPASVSVGSRIGASKGEGAMDN